MSDRKLLYTYVTDEEETVEEEMVEDADDDELITPVGPDNCLALSTPASCR